ncbi:eukaryotic integral membrane protein [Paramyrothecium foliicola]|nr:eukaryotic integral membrane protein [Paramyrothecium foliicola]
MTNFGSSIPRLEACREKSTIQPEKTRTIVEEANRSITRDEVMAEYQDLFDQIQSMNNRIPFIIYFWAQSRDEDYGDIVEMVAKVKTEATEYQWIDNKTIVLPQTGAQNPLRTVANYLTIVAQYFREFDVGKVLRTLTNMIREAIEWQECYDQRELKLTQFYFKKAPSRSCTVMTPRLNLPPVTRGLLAALLFQSVVNAAIRYRQWTNEDTIVVPYLTLVPQLSVVYPWTFLTTTLVENNIFTLAIAGVTLFQGGRYLERAWSSAELAKFVVLVSLVPNLLTILVMVTFYALTRNANWSFMVISGTVSLQVSFLVAFSQLVPAHTVTLFRGIISLRVPRFPLLYVGIVTILSLTPLLPGAAPWLAVFGLLTSWTYLRFYKTVFPDLDSSQQASLRGDASETFAFAEFFPAPVKPAVAAFADQIFNVLVAMRLCTPFSPANVSAARGDNLLPRGTPGSARAEAERRRAIALRALDQRLHAASSNPANRAPPQPPSQPTGPTVQSQPHPSTQTAMTSQPGQMLGDTKFEPEHDGDAAKN